ncbi:MAG: hypothetical protein SOZ22_01955 [Ezakiella sp.]|nr:hypothetical protein [Ezakiella sp.]
MSKKTLLIIVSVVLVLSLIDNITAKDNANYQSIYDKTEKHFFSMKEFRNEYKLDKMKAMEKIKLKTDWLINRENKNEVNYIERFGYDPDYPSISFPHFKQKNSYYCGPASALTALYFQGSGNRVGGNGYIEKQDTIAKDADTSMGSKYKPGGGLSFINLLMQLTIIAKPDISTKLV